MVVVGQNRLRGTSGQLAQVPLLRRSHPTTSSRVTFQSRFIPSIGTRILLPNGPRNIRMGPLQLHSNEREQERQ